MDLDLSVSPHPRLIDALLMIYLVANHIHYFRVYRCSVYYNGGCVQPNSFVELFDGVAAVRVGVRVEIGC